MRTGPFAARLKEGFRGPSGRILTSHPLSAPSSRAYCFLVIAILLIQFTAAALRKAIKERKRRPSLLRLFLSDYHTAGRASSLFALRTAFYHAAARKHIENGLEKNLHIQHKAYMCRIITVQFRLDGNGQLVPAIHLRVT